MGIMSPQKQLEYNKGLFMYRVLNKEAPGYDNKGLFMYRVLKNEAPEYHLTCIYTLPHAIPTLGTISLVCLGQGQTYS